MLEILNNVSKPNVITLKKKRKLRLSIIESIFDKCTLNNNEKICLIYIASYIEINDLFELIPTEFTIKNISKYCSISNRTATKCLKSLCEKNILFKIVPSDIYNEHNDILFYSGNFYSFISRGSHGK